MLELPGEYAPDTSVAFCGSLHLCSVCGNGQLTPHSFLTHSGSGKSTLLDILAQRKTVGKIKGEVLIAGEKPTQTFLRRYTGYVEQFDTLIPVLTVYEMLLYTAELKTPRAVPFKVICHTHAPALSHRLLLPTMTY